jgi:hypothetical protein
MKTIINSLQRIIANLFRERRVKKLSSGIIESK